MPRQLVNQKGLTLIELLIVIAILAVIAAIAVTLYQDVEKKVRLSADRGTMAAVRSAVAIYYGGNAGIFPTKAKLNILVVPAYPVFRCAGATYTADATNGTIMYTPNDISLC